MEVCCYKLVEILERIMNIIAIQDKLQYLVSRCYTKLAQGNFASFGSGSIIFFPARIHNPHNIFVGNKVLLQSQVWLNAVDQWNGMKYDSKIVIGDNTCIMNNVQISSISQISIGKNVGISRNCLVVDHIHDYTVVDEPILSAPLSEGRPVTIEDDVFIGFNCIIAPGVVVGRHSFVAANSLVNRDIPPYCFAAGTPAKVRRVYDHKAREWVRFQQDTP